ncbi:MAG: hypothetical protein JWQ19_1742 [Subtercola sp.]|nr:hypothetical protein [Subtercola sp.]
MNDFRPLRAEDLVIGERTDIGTHTPSLGEIVDFASQWDPQVFHVDIEAATAGFFGGIIGSGIHSLAIYQRLAVQNLFAQWDVIAGRSIDSIQLTAPLRPDVPVHGLVTVQNIVFSHDDRALVTTLGELRPDDGKPILTIVADSYVRRIDRR